MSKQRISEIGVEFFVGKMNSSIISGNFIHHNSINRIIFLINNHIDILKNIFQIFGKWC